jgi:outer membrane protein
MRNKKFFLIFILFFSIINFVKAEINIAYIDMQYIMDNSLAGKSIKKQLEELHKKNLSDFKKKEESLKKKEKEVIAKKNILSDEEFQKEISKLRTNVKNYNLERNDRINSLTKKRIESMESIVKSLSPIIADFSKKNNISLIVDKKYIIVGKTELNVTKKILDILNSKIKKIVLN